MIIDGHSHIGDDYRHGNSDIRDYINFCNDIGVDHGLVMPVPFPKKLNSDDPCLLWHYDNGFVINASRNPYVEVNYELKEIVEKNNNQGMSLFYVPMIHPKLDDIEVLDKLIDETDPVALKLHGMWGGFGANDFSKELLDYLEYKGIPLIVHTHWDSSKKEDRPIRPSEESVAQNNGLAYANLFKDRNIHVTLNHGARLQKEALEIVNNADNLKVALGPDCVLQNATFRVDQDADTLLKKGYLRILKEALKENKIIFDVDYNFNAAYPDSYLDTRTVERVNDIFYDNLDNVMYNNLLEQYPKVKMKVRK